MSLRQAYEKISKQHLALFLNIHRWKWGEKNRTRQHFAILTEIIITYLLVPQHIARQSLPLVFGVWQRQTEFMPKTKEGQSQEGWPSILGLLGPSYYVWNVLKFLLETCTSTHQSLKSHHRPCRHIIAELLLQGGTDCCQSPRQRLHPLLQLTTYCCLNFSNTGERLRHLVLVSLTEPMQLQG